MGNKEKTEKRKKGVFRPIKCLIALAVVAVLFISVLRYRTALSSMLGLKDAIVGEEGEVTTITETSLEEVFEISELSTVDFSYNAIAKQYDESGTELKYYVAYNGTVNAGIDFEQIQIEIDNENKVIQITVPDATIQNTTVDFGSMEYIFVDKSAETEDVSQEAYEICRQDLAQRAQDESELLSMAQDNAVSVIEALVVPWVNQLDSDFEVVIN